MTRSNLILTFCLLFALPNYSQILNNTLLGFQEPTTKILSIRSDSNNYIYYYGTFKGELVRDGQSLLTGYGGDDIFILKTDTSGNLVWVRGYGGAGNESIINAGDFGYADGAIFFSSLITYTTQMGSFTIEPYSVDRPVSCIVRVDTANGDVVWARRTSLLVTNVQAANNYLMLSGNVTATRGPWLFEQQTLQDSTGISRLGIIYLDRAGNYLGKKQLYLNYNGAPAVPLVSPKLTAAGQLYFSLSTNNGSGQPTNLFIQDSAIALPASRQFQAVFTTDSSFSNIRYRTLNLSASFLQFSGGTNMGVSYKTGCDSLYMLLTTNAALNYTLDGFNVPLQYRVTMVVMDSSLQTARVSTLVQYSGTQRINYLTIIPHNGSLYFPGVFNATNQAEPLVPIPSNMQTIDFFYGLTQSLDINGPSKSMIVKASPDLTQRSVLWLGDAIPYIGQTMAISSFTTNGKRIYLSNTNDELWNPWIIDSTLAIGNGTMVGGRDRSEVSRQIQFFNDGSRFIQGEANGKTAYDTSSAGIVKSSAKSDIYFVRLSPTNSLVWYKKTSSSFRGASQVKTLIRNNKAYVLMTMTNPANATGYNYFKIDTAIVNVTTSQYCMLLVFNADGSYRLVDLNNLAGGRTIVSFDVYDNGDLAAISSASNTAATINGVSFPSGQGYFILRLDSLGSPLQALKYQTTLNYCPGPRDILVQPGSNELTILSNLQFTSGMVSRSLSITDGQQFTDNFTLVNPTLNKTRSYLDIMKTRMNGGRRSATIGPVSNSVGFYSPPYVLNGTQLFVPLMQTGIKDTLYLNTQVLNPDTTNNLTYILSVDTSNQVVNSRKILPSVGSLNPTAFTINKLSSYGSKIYASGYINGTSLIDTIQVGYSGGGADGLAIQFDTLLHAKRSFRLSSIYYEAVNDCAVYNDSLISFAYTAQSVPVCVNNRSASVNPGDLDEDAYVGNLTLNNIITALPVKWLGVDAHCKDGKVHLSWSTAGELNNSHFIIQRTEVSGRWTDIGEVRSAGTSNDIQRYLFTDNFNDVALYRILQVDLDGRSSFSPVVVNRCDKSLGQVYIFPNPARQHFIIKGASDGSAYHIFNSFGHLVQKGMITSGQYQLDIQELPSGVYLVVVRDHSGNSKTQKIQIQR